MALSIPSKKSPAFVLHSTFCFLDARPLFVLVLLTLAGGAIRFTHLSHPCLWYDESMVYWRTCGTYGQLLDCLRTDGFVPLHYSLIWFMCHWPEVMPDFVAHAFKLSPNQFVQRCAWMTHPTPFLLRLVPAISGTLMVPAIYFFAVHLLPRKTALLAAAIAACSGFAIYYSRDAKMYMDSWLFVTLNLGCLLWWFRSRCTTAWLCWVLSGCIACGLQITSAIPIALSLLLLLTQDRVHWKIVLAWIGGMLLIAAGPIGHYEKFNTWVERSDENWADSGLQWINAYNSNRDGPQHVRYLSTMLGIGWEWPRESDIARLPRQRFEVPSTCAYVLLILLLIACLPWPGKRGRGPFSAAKTFPVPFNSDDAINTSTKRGRGRFFGGKKVPVPFFADGEGGPQPQWRVLLWLGVLSVLPVYGFYCHAVAAFAGPREWWHWLGDHHDQLKQMWWVWAAIAVVILWHLVEPFTHQPIRPAIRESGQSTLRCLLMLTVVAVIIGLCWAIDLAMTAQQKAAAEAGKGWQSLWVPRYLGFVWPALIVAIAALLMRLPTRPLRIAAVLFFLGINLAVGSIRIFGQTEPPVDRMAADYLAADSSTNRTLVRMDIDRGAQYPGGGNLLGGPGEYYLDLLGHVTTDPPGFKKSILRRQGFGLFPARSLTSIPGGINRVIVWNQFTVPSMYAPMTPRRFRACDEPIARMSGWHLVIEQEFIARDCWIWEDLAMYRRREYARD